MDAWPTVAERIPGCHSGDHTTQHTLAFGDCAVGAALFSGRTSHETPAMTILLLVPIAEQRHCARNENRADDGGINSAAAQLGVGRPTNYRWMDDCSLDHDHDEVSGRTFLVPQRPDIRRPVAAELIAWMTS